MLGHRHARPPARSDRRISAPPWDRRACSSLRRPRATWPVRPCAGRFPRRGARPFPWPWRPGRARAADGLANSSGVWGHRYSYSGDRVSPWPRHSWIERPDFAGLFGGATEQHRAGSPYAVVAAELAEGAFDIGFQLERNFARHRLAALADGAHHRPAPQAAGMGRQRGNQFFHDGGARARGGPGAWHVLCGHEKKRAAKTLGPPAARLLQI